MVLFEEPVHFDESLGIKIAIVGPQEEITMSTYKSFKNTLESLCENGPHQVIVDLSRVEYIDSIGFGAIVNFRKKFKEKNGDLVIAGMNLRLRHIYDFLGLKPVLPVKFTIEESIYYFSYKVTDADEILKQFKSKLKPT